MSEPYAFREGDRVILVKPFQCARMDDKPSHTDLDIRRQIEAAYGAEIPAGVIQEGQYNRRDDLVGVVFDASLGRRGVGMLWVQTDCLELENIDAEVEAAIQSILKM